MDFHEHDSNTCFFAVGSTSKIATWTFKLGVALISLCRFLKRGMIIELQRTEGEKYFIQWHCGHLWMEYEHGASVEWCEQGIIEISEEEMSHCYHKSHVDWFGIRPHPLWWKASDKLLGSLCGQEIYKRYINLIGVIFDRMWNNNMMAMPSFQVYTVKSLLKNALECSFLYINLGLA